MTKLLSTTPIYVQPSFTYSLWQEAEKATEAEKIRKETILSGNPLLKLGNGSGGDFAVKRRFNSDDLWKIDAFFFDIFCKLLDGFALSTGGGLQLYNIMRKLLSCL